MLSHRVWVLFCGKKTEVVNRYSDYMVIFFLQEWHMQNCEDKSKTYIPENNVSIQNQKHTYKTEYNSIQRKFLFHWMSNASEAALCEVMKAINPVHYKKLLGPDKARLHALLVAADRVRSRLERTGRKNSDRDLSGLEEANELHVSMVVALKKRRSPKREKIALHEGVIRQLFARGLSLRQVCAYLKRHAGFDVNHAYLRQCCRDMGIETRKGTVANTGGDTPVRAGYGKDA